MMNHEQYIQTIVSGTEAYFRAFALADRMSHQQGAIEWVAPLPGGKGPALVFKVSLSDSAEEAIEKLIPELQDGKVPSIWVLSPLTNPKIFNLLAEKGFAGGPDSSEWGMAMEMKTLADLPAPNPLVEVKKVISLTDFQVWMDVVNTALHGWDMLTIEHYSAWLVREEFAFYLGYIDGVPVSTVATIRNGNSAGVEFVSTLREYHGRGAGYTVCLRALHDLQATHIETATLIAFADGVKLYEKLGFRKYYNQVMYSFRKVDQPA